MWLLFFNLSATSFAERPFTLHLLLSFLEFAGSLSVMLSVLMRLWRNSKRVKMPKEINSTATAGKSATHVPLWVAVKQNLKSSITRIQTKPDDYSAVVMDDYNAVVMKDRLRALQGGVPRPPEAIPMPSLSTRHTKWW